MSGKSAVLCACIGVLAMSAGLAMGQSAAPKLPEQDRALSRSILKELIEINSQDSNGSVTAAANGFVPPATNFPPGSTVASTDFACE